MANHTKNVVTTDIQQKLLWDIIVDDGDNVGVDAWIQSEMDAKINGCWKRMQSQWTTTLMNDSGFTDDIPSNQADFVALVIARDDYKNRKAQDDANAH
jgi:hypothetical protein